MIKNANLFVTKYLTSQFLDQIGLQSWRNLMKRFGTSYFWATLLLPHDIQQATVELYKFVRIPDEIVDGIERGDINIQTTQFENLYQDRKQTYQDQNTSHPIFGQRVFLMNEYEINSDLVDSFYQAMRDDLTISRYASYEQLQWYMYGSAKVVWLMMCDIVWYDQTYQQATLDGARKLGEAMQLTNFLRDVCEDYADLDRIYMPSDDLAQFGLTHDDIAQFCQSKQINDRWVSFMKHMVDRCDQLYDQANITISYLTPSCQSAILLSSDLYRAILRKIESIWYNQFARSARTTKRDKLKVIARRQVLCKFIIQCISDQRV
jgi:15-cis-phytoene synthase